MKRLVTTAAALIAAATFARAQDSQAEAWPALSIDEMRLDLENEWQDPKPEKKQDDGAFKFFYKDGFKFETADKAFKGQISGRIQVLHTGQSSSDFSASDGTEFRRAYLAFSGTLHEVFDFKLEVDFSASGQASSDRPGYADVYIRLRKSPLGDITVGHFKEPFSLEELTSDLFLTFIERSVHSCFSPSRNTGILFSGSAMEDHLTWAIGVFRDTNGIGDLESTASEGDNRVTGRITYLALYEDKGETLLHLGLAVSRQSPNGDSVTYTQTPGTHVSATPSLTTGAMSVEEVTLYGFEVAGVFGQFSAQAEYVMSQLQGKGATPDNTFSAWYIQLSAFLTGERKDYRKTSGTFGRVSPKANAFKDGGSGAIEVTIRIDRLSFEDDTEFGTLKTVTIGINWILNPNTKIMVNFVSSDFEDATGGPTNPDGKGKHLTIQFGFDF
jgi:phosphate-selective porin OprO/OprP